MGGQLMAQIDANIKTRTDLRSHSGTGQLPGSTKWYASLDATDFLLSWRQSPGRWRGAAARQCGTRGCTVNEEVFRSRSEMPSGS